MIIFGLEIRWARKESALQKMQRLSSELTIAWTENYVARNNVVPWTDWSEKTVFVAERGAIREVETNK